MKILLSVILLILSGCSTLPNSKQIQTEHGVFTYYLSGTNKPTVIFESGLGDDMTSWEPVIKQVEEVADVFTYNRAGFSGSKSKNITRNGQVIVTELRELLTSANLKPPYILVGHSIGGAYMELYAKTYPSEIQGVVLVAPNLSKYPTRCKLEGLDECDPPSAMPLWATLFFPPAVEGEIKGFNSTHSQINAIDSFPNIPLVVLSSPNKHAEQTDKKNEETNFMFKCTKK